jgi:glycosyltransferase involved in cell wall biosynthesis
MSPARVTTVIAELGVGGAEVVAVTVATAAARAGHDVTVASSPGSHVARLRVAQLRAAGVPHVPVPLVGRHPLGLARALARLRAGRRPDLVHAHNPKATLVARLALGPDVPLLTTLHGVSDAELPRAARLLRRASTRVAVVSPHLAEKLAGAGCPGDRIDVVRNAVAPLAPYSRTRARAELGIPADAVVCLCLARMVDQKRHDLLVRAWASLHTPAVLLLAGDGPNRPRVVRDVERSGLGGNVRLLGARSDVPRLVAASDLLVLPTDWEGLPISVLEAMAAGLPVVASRVDGLATELAGAVRFVEPGSAPDLATGLADLIGSPSLRADLAARGRVVAAERFGADAMVARYLDLYASLAGSRGGTLTRSGGPR